MSGALRKSIGPKRHAMTQRYNAAKGLLDLPIPTGTLECEELICSLNTSIRKLSDSIGGFESIDQHWHKLMESLEDSSKLSEEEVHYEKFATDSTDGYLAWVELCRDTLHDMEGRVKMIDSRIAVHRRNDTRAKDSGQNTSQRNTRAKLPKLTLPTFEGKDSIEWHQFWSIFAANVDDQDLNDIEKLTYLIAQLRGTALETIKGLSISDSNYAIAVDLLKKRFQRSKGSVIRMLYSQLKQLPCCGKSISTVRQTYNDSEALLRQLEEAGEDLSSNVSLAVDILSKYSAVVIRELAHRYSVTDDSSVSEIRRAIQNYVSDAEELSENLSRLRLVTVPQDAKPKPDYPSSSPDASSKPTSALSTVDRKSPTAKSPTSNSVPAGACYFCEGTHFNSECPTYSTATARIAQLRKRGRCERCGRDQHATKDCRRQIRCIHCKTTNHHYTALCKMTFPSPTATFAATPVSKSKPPECRTKSTTIGPSETPIDTRGDRNITMINVAERSALLTARADVIDNTTGQRRKARLIFDSASHRSYITSSLADILGLESAENQLLKVSIFGTKRTLTMSSRVVSFSVQQRDGSLAEITAHTTPLITHCSVLPQDLRETDRTLLESMKYAPADDFDESGNAVDILVGSEYFWDFITGSRITTTSGLLLIPSTLGLLLAGRYATPSTNQSQMEKEFATMLCLTERERPPIVFDTNALTALSPKGKPVSPDIDEFWHLERIGISDDPTESDDDKALSSFNESISQEEDGRYHVKWPWIEEKKALLPSNYELSLGRLRSLLKRFKKDGNDLSQKYRELIDMQCANGIIERVPEAEVQKPRFPIHYLPHHPVVKMSSETTKVRIVYDASSKCRQHQVSLNECIYRGPVMLPQLCHVLLRFRCYPFVIIADVEKAFLQMALQPSERDVTRFLWLQSFENLHVENNIAVYRFCRVPFGIIASPFLLGATIQHHLRKYSGNDSNATASDEGRQKSLTTADLIARDVYVDNVTCGADTEDELVQTQRNMKSLFNDCKMNLQEFCSNSDAVLQQISADDQTKHRDVKMLGLKWDSKNDTLQLSKRSISAEVTTKRMMLHTIASIFDPLGLFQPAILSAKLVLQKLWETDLGWDDLVPQRFLEEWRESLKGLDGIFERKIKRYIGSVNAGNGSSIVVFCDASAKGYAAAVYLRNPIRATGGDNWTTNLLFSKSRLTPKAKAITLPRLELLGVVIGIKAAQFVRKAFDAHCHIPIHLFTDAKVVLHWIETKKLLSRFVANRIKAIRSVPNVHFHHVASESNPADFSTRGKSATDLLACDSWWHGPSFLKTDEADWPSKHTKLSPQTERDVANEYRECKIMHTFTTVDQVTPSEDHFSEAGRCVIPKSRVFRIDIDRFSTLRRLLRSTVVVVKFLKRLVWDKLSQETKTQFPNLDAKIRSFSNTSSELQTAKDSWVQAVQQTHFFAEINAIQNGTKHPMIAQLGLKLDETGILRSYSRYEHADLPYDVKYPKLLPNKDRLTTLLINDIHARLFHAGISHTLSEVRREFWIIRGRAAVRSAIQQCVICRKSKGHPFTLPKMPPWPSERLVQQPPFHSTGLDYMGPISVKVGDVVKKAWICLFTCLVVRAVHLEVVADCTAKEFTDCLIRFVSRRGTPKLIISDNAPQFRTTKTVLDRIWHRTLTDSSLASYCAEQGIEWKFTIQLAPWQGGFYERLIQIVKRTMRSAVGRRLLSWSDLVTLTAEIEAVVNTRPITYVQSDHLSRLRVLRPIDFVCDLSVRYPNIEVSNINNSDLGEAGKLLVSHWKSRQKRRRQFWDLWKSEYLLSLRERGDVRHRRHRSEVGRVPCANEIIILRDDDTPRGAWKMARVKRLIPSDDGEVRAVELELPNKSVLRRAINFCYPLEISTSGEENSDSFESSGQHDSTSSTGNNLQRADDIEEEFLGFTPEDIQRTLNAMQRFNPADPGTTTAVANALLTCGLMKQHHQCDQTVLIPGLATHCCSIDL